MIEARRSSPLASLSPVLVRRNRPLRLAPPARAIQLPVVYDARRAARAEWASDLRFFLACYAAGILFFLVMLS